jgi:cytosine/uracil/thiamine/allantoin permease
MGLSTLNFIGIKQTHSFTQLLMAIIIAYLTVLTPHQLQSQNRQQWSLESL